jgi:hypothetical protein
MVGHWLAYDAGISGSTQRSEVLAQTGHSYWQLGVRAAAVALAMGLGAILVRRIGDSSAASRTRVERLSFTTARLIALQVGAYCAMEAAERLAAGVPLGGMLAHHLLVLGVALQVLTALVGALLLTLFDRGVVRLVSALRRRRRTPAPRRVARLPSRPFFARRSLLLAGATGPRSPPRS